MALGKGLFYLFWLLVATFFRIGILWMIPGSNPYTQFDNSVCAMGEILPYDNSTYSIFQHILIIASFSYFLNRFHIMQQLK